MCGNIRPSVGFVEGIGLWLCVGELWKENWVAFLEAVWTAGLTAVSSRFNRR